jgi:hypothetical protein
MKLYILACQKLSKPQQFVQGTHAAIEWARNNPQDHPPVVMLQCPDIEEWRQKLWDHNIEYHDFEDSYYGRITAIASSDISGYMVEDLKLI